MQLSLGRTDISHEAVLADYARFGLRSGSEANMYLQALLQRIEFGLTSASPVLTDKVRHMMTLRVQKNLGLLRGK